MTGRSAALRAPTPNCGHGGNTFTHVALINVWLCPLCMASIGPLYRTCSSCGRPPPPRTELVATARDGSQCVRCRGITRSLRNT